MALYKGFRHERSKGEDGLRINYWYLIRPDGGEDLAVIGREIKGSGGHYNYNSAPLFGMLSWVNSSEVRRWLQTKIADPQTLRCTSAPQDKAFGNPISRHDSDTHLTGAQDGMPGMPLPSHHPDMAWAGPSLVRSGMRVPDPAPMHGMQPGASLFRGVQHSEVPPPDAHERNAMIGHTLGAVDALLAALRRRVGVEYTLTVVTQEREVHVMGSAGARWRPSSEQTPSPFQAVDVSSSSGLGRSSDALDGQGNAFTGAQAQVPSAMAMPAVNGSAALQDGDGLGDAVLPGRDSIAHPFEVPREGQEEGLTPTWQLQTKRALSDLWNLSELEESRKRSAHDGSLPMQLPDGLSNPLDPVHATMAMEHCLP
ncbi:hypothetical protein CVIRNUC_001560 [Coccomyxa viridis]|uniref:Uncharacterized protein n=1 Tax=Coccomyxa viridis TaxID=1274662 RepID=A0AAV1HVR8_9CHLO|nr:hypothetical protein CVIRNUC_001560 [Coccomyxa viridis]